ncbi:MAG TPA: hypothetical protein VN108_02680 [Marmoricola sp.]|nr:hypothetical protein [Marmoricola sp.]
MNEATMVMISSEPALAESARPRWRIVLEVVVVVGVLVGLAAWGLVQALQLRDHGQRQDDRAAAVAAASRQVVLLTTVTASTSAKDINKMLAGAAPSFRKEFEKGATAFFNTLKAAKVTSQGAVDATGVVSASGTAAEVLVAATGRVSNVTTKSPESRTYRLDVNLVKANGQWLVSGMRFVG